jgi:hypothetical protein
MMNRAWLLIAILTAACSDAEPTDRAPAAAADSTVPVTTAATANADTTFFGRMIGIGSNARDHRECLTIANDALTPGARVLVVSPRPPQRVDTAVVLVKRDRACTEAGDEWGNANIENAAYYNLQFADSMDFSGPTFVLAIANASLIVQDSMVTGDVDGDGTPERFHACTSREGIHHFVFAGDAQRWHVYYYVPYDLEPNCDARLFQTGR